jgi:hypothetical protein
MWFPIGLTATLIIISIIDKRWLGIRPYDFARRKDPNTDNFQTSNRRCLVRRPCCWHWCFGWRPRGIHDVSGTISVVVSGNWQSVRLNSEAGTASLELHRYNSAADHYRGHRRTEPLSHRYLAGTPTTRKPASASAMQAPMTISMRMAAWRWSCVSSHTDLAVSPLALLANSCPARPPELSGNLVPAALPHSGQDTGRL